jgi:hypothetical protein
MITMNIKTKYYLLIVLFSVTMFSCNTGKHFERDTAITDGLYGDTPASESNLSE